MIPAPLVQAVVSVLATLYDEAPEVHEADARQILAAAFAALPQYLDKHVRCAYDSSNACYHFYCVCEAGAALAREFGEGT